MKYTLNSFRLKMLMHRIIILSYDSINYKTFSKCKGDIVDLIIPYIKNTTDVLLKMQCIQSLGVPGFFSASPFLVSLYEQEASEKSLNYDMLGIIAEALYRIKNKSMIEWYYKQLESPNLRLEAIKFMEAIYEMDGKGDDIVQIMINLTQKTLVLPPNFYGNPLEENKYYLSIYCLKRLSKRNFDNKKEFASMFRSKLDSFICFSDSDWQRKMYYDTRKNYLEVLAKF